MPENVATLEWIAVATLDDFWEGEVTDVQVGDELILLVHLNGGDIRAYQGHCPHQKTALADGELEGNVSFIVTKSRSRMELFSLALAQEKMEKIHGECATPKIRRPGVTRHEPRHHRGATYSDRS
jgi:hypothetical protein